MGTSIHMHIEVKRDDKWLHFAAPHIFRDGVFFNLLAEVYENSKFKPIVPLRGLPMDIPGTEMSEVTKFCYEQDRNNRAVHHVGYLHDYELMTLQEKLWDIFGDKGENDHDLEFHYFNTLINGNTVAQHQGWDDVRLIYWFDN